MPRMSENIRPGQVFAIADWIRYLLADETKREALASGLYSSFARTTRREGSTSLLNPFFECNACLHAAFNYHRKPFPRTRSIRSFLASVPTAMDRSHTVETLQVPARSLAT